MDKQEKLNLKKWHKKNIDFFNTYWEGTNLEKKSLIREENRNYNKIFTELANGDEEKVRIAIKEWSYTYELHFTKWFAFHTDNTIFQPVKKETINEQILEYKRAIFYLNHRINQIDLDDTGISIFSEEELKVLRKDMGEEQSLRFVQEEQEKQKNAYYKLIKVWQDKINLLEEEAKQFRKDEGTPLPQTEPEKLELLFKSISKYNTIMEILVSKNLVQPNTYIWKDEKKGNKSYLAALIKNLHSKGYYKENTRPTNPQIMAICKNSFGWDVGLDTIKHINALDFDFTFIPIASTID